MSSFSSPFCNSGIIMAGVLFEDIFVIKDIDPDGKKFERGMVLTCTLDCLYHFRFFSFQTFL